ncbi:hypothetical protein EES42_43385 [Streptomyces sp. ADI95-17]|nr:hypothetical protein EES42_43385 [Streptomyces sp. ADI95-17]
MTHHQWITRILRRSYGKAGPSRAKTSDAEPAWPPPGRAERAVGRVWPAGAAPALAGGCIGRRGSVAIPAAVAGDLAGDGRRRSAQPLGQLPGRFSGDHPAGHLLALAAAQIPLRSCPRGETDAAALVQEATGVPHRCPECPSDQAERPPLAPASPDLILLSRRKPVVTHLRLHDYMIIRGWCVDHLRVPSFADTRVCSVAGSQATRPSNPSVRSGLDMDRLTSSHVEVPDFRPGGYSSRPMRRQQGEQHEY